jgi:putative transposase
MTMLNTNHRKNLRLPNFDYAQNGAYFITIVTEGRMCLFGEVVNGEMVLNEVGLIVQKAWDEIPNHFPNVTCDTYVIMPNHIHGIIVIEREYRSPVVGATHESPLPQHHNGPKPGSIGAILGLFKSTVSKRSYAMTNTPKIPFWQRNYYEHVIRDENDHLAAYDYILTNPLNWERDEER